MDLNEIQKMIQEDGGKFIIVEQGKPILVITSFEDYKKKKANPQPEQTEQSVGDEELQIEDLPL